jgi:hypothetical protein
VKFLFKKSEVSARYPEVSGKIFELETSIKVVFQNASVAETRNFKLLCEVLILILTIFKGSKFSACKISCEKGGKIYIKTVANIYLNILLPPCYSCNFCTKNDLKHLHEWLEQPWSARFPKNRSLLVCYSFEVYFTSFSYELLLQILNTVCISISRTPRPMESEG